ncbi:cell shape determination protein CcmA [Rhodoferax lacus]|uniref:Cell shape determination protein CcmA n=1 Tax=Rhodoferax lacus TaxID=2184758 RepID=A0A3E1R9Y8_9BURK|nr:polymer-forming cytoskeletal protein [Rhodoferax lacus]RFO95842.1 cell shape determination protein CcmA [Rhodoferax lacus]
MSMQAPFFGKRPADPVLSRPSQAQPVGMSGASTGAAAAPLASPAPVPMAAPVVAPVVDTVAAASFSSAPTKEGGSKLTVGPNIKLKGVEITDCDTLVVEGTVEATMDSRVMHITEIGAFKGSAEIDYAEIHGEFNGDLTVREKLVIYATGRVIGKIRYGKLVIQEGGQMTGDIQFGAASKTRELPVAKMGLINAA